jgi:hypothetical protein
MVKKNGREKVRGRVVASATATELHGGCSNGHGVHVHSFTGQSLSSKPRHLH